MAAPRQFAQADAASRRSLTQAAGAYMTKDNHPLASIVASLAKHSQRAIFLLMWIRSSSPGSWSFPRRIN